LKHISRRVLDHLHVVFAAPQGKEVMFKGLDTLPERLRSKVDVVSAGSYECAALDMVKEILADEGKDVEAAFWTRMDSIAREIANESSSQSVAPFDTFLHLYKRYAGGCRRFYVELRNKVAALAAAAKSGAEEAEAKAAGLAAAREESRALSSRQVELQRQNGALRKDIEELTENIGQHEKTIDEENMTVVRSKLTVGQELASSYALCQAKVADLGSAAGIERSVEIYQEILIDGDGAAAKYVKLFFEALSLDYYTSVDKISELQASLSSLSEEGVHSLAEGASSSGKATGPTPLQIARKEITQELKSKSDILELLTECHRRVEALAKVVRLKNGKFARIETIGKNVAREEEELRSLRGKR